jgi:GDP-L-fucose synthase
MKIASAKRENRDSIELWGTGTPKREFLYVDDLADGLIFLMKNYSGESHVNVGTGKEMTIRELAERIAKAAGWTGRLTFDPSKPDGTPRKVMDVSRMTRMGWTAKTPFDEGIARTYRMYEETSAS